MSSNRVWVALAAMAGALGVAGCSASETSGGTVVYSERGTANVRVLDVATGGSELIDNGHFGSVSIAPDAAHVAYAGVDEIMKVADRSGTITSIMPGGGCAGRAEWLTNRSLAYCASLPDASGMLLLPGLDGATPRFTGQTPAVSGDGTHVSYVDARGDVIVEALDGSDHRVLVPSPDPSAMYPSTVVSFTPDQRAVLVGDITAQPKLHIVALADGVSIDVDDTRPVAGPFGPTIFYGASSFSPDGSQIVTQSSTGLVTIDLASGEKHMLAPFADRISSAGAVFLDAAHVLWVRAEDQSVGDLGAFSLSVHVAALNGDDDREIDAPHADSHLLPSIGVSREGFIALPNDASIITQDGTLVVGSASPETANEDILGVTQDGRAFIALSNDGVVRYEGVDGTQRDLATVGGMTGLIDPYAAYTPAQR